MYKYVWHDADIPEPDTFAVTSLLFAYLTSDTLFFNVKFDNLGNHKASGLEALGRLFDYILEAASQHSTVKFPKLSLVYVIRDFRDAADKDIPPGSGRTKKDVEAQCADLMNDLWTQRKDRRETNKSEVMKKKSEVRVNNATRPRPGGADGVIS